MQVPATTLSITYPYTMATKAFQPKELKKGGKPAQVVAPIKLVQEENKAFLRALFAGEIPAVYGAHVTSLEMAHEKSQASAGIKGGRGGCGIVNFSMTFGTDTDKIIQTELGGETVVPQRFLSQRGDVHQDVFGLGDVVITRVSGNVKVVNVGTWTGEQAVRGRGWHEVYAWIPAEKVERAIKEGRLILSVVEKREREAAEAAKAAADAAQAAKATAEALADIERRKAVGGGGETVDGEELGSW